MDYNSKASDPDTEFNPTLNDGGGHQSQSGEYRLPHALHPLRTTTFLVKSLHCSMINGSIELDSEYVTIVFEYILY